MLGLERGRVLLLPYDASYASEAEKCIALLKSIFGSTAVDIQHVGSTSIPGIRSKPIIDIIVALDSITEIEPFREALRQNGFVFCKYSLVSQLLFVCGNDNIRTHHIHVVEYGSMDYINYVNFRDYLCAFPEKALEYEKLKTQLAAEFASDRERYTGGKAEFITHTLRKALIWSYMGKDVNVKIDRPVGYVHRKGDKTLVYPINYGYIEGILGGDGEELDVYVLCERKPLKSFTGHIIAAAERLDDVEDKLIAAPAGVTCSREYIENEIRFQEKYYSTFVKLNKNEIGNRPIYPD